MAMYKSWEALPPYGKDRKIDHYTVSVAVGGKPTTLFFDNYLEAQGFAEAHGKSTYESVWTDEFGYLHVTTRYTTLYWEGKRP